MKKKSIPANDAKAWRKEALRLKKELEQLTFHVIAGINLLDVIMKQPSTSARGSTVAKVLNGLEVGNDHARHFGLGISFKSKKWLKDKEPTAYIEARLREIQG